MSGRSTLSVGKVLVLLSIISISAYGVFKYRGMYSATSNSSSSLDSSLIISQQATGEDESSPCVKWAVIAPTDLEWASEAVRRQTRLQGWCLVIVFEKKPSMNYDPGWYVGRGNRAIVYITKDDMNYLNELAALTGIPWNDVGRKIIGYLYAIARGATVIWEFDDNNMLKFWIPGAAPPGAPSLETAVPATETIKVRVPESHSWPTYNPYPAMGAPALPSWPRGLPLDDASQGQCSKGQLKEYEEQSGSIAVLQSLSDHQPDADVIYQGTMPFPFFFQRTSETSPLLVPSHAFSPYNTKATLHLQAGFWAMYLPLTVAKELTDTWRSYIAQRLFWDVGLRIGFMARPLVVQDHSIHTTTELIQSCLKSSNRTKQLITFLGTWRGRSNTFVHRIEELWTALCEQNFINSYDIDAVRSWIRGLKNIGYVFPQLKDKSISFPMYPSENTWKIPVNYYVDTDRYISERNMLECDNEICESPKASMTFWTSDAHYGTRLDMSSFLGSLGHNVYEAVGRRQNYHPEVWQMKGVHIYNKVSDVIQRDYPDWTGLSSRMKEVMIRENFEFYKTDSIIHSVDAFYCLMPASMCEMWMPFNKTIIMIPAHRYNIGRCTRAEFDRLNEHLHMLASMEHPKHIMAASSKYDMEYLRHYTGIRDVLPLYAHTATYIRDKIYAPTRDEILLFLRRWIRDLFWDDRFKTDIKKFKIVDQSKFYKTYSFSNFIKHRAVVFLPYAVMSYKIVELYSMGIPMFFPSMKFLQNIKPIGDDRTIVAHLYCGKTGLGIKDSDMVAHPNSIHPYSPNLQETIDKEAEYYWLQLADYFQWPHITYFDDFKDLERKLSEADFSKIHELMMQENKRRKKKLENNWCKVFNQIEKGREVPQNYDTAIKELYGVTRLQKF